jgi:predicted amidohydrolase
VNLRVALAQYPIDFLGSWSAYEAKLGRWVEEAAANGAGLLLFPEYGSMELASLFAEEIRQDLTRQIEAMQLFLPRVERLHSELAKHFGLYILGASLPVRLADGHTVNRAHFFGPSGRHGFQDKRVMTRFERESWGIAAGVGAKLFETSFGRVGVSICYDAEFPLKVRAMGQNGAKLLLVPSCTDTEHGWNRIRLAARARALENQFLALVAPTVGQADWSPAVDANVGAAGVYGPPDLGYPSHGILLEGVRDRPSWIFAELDLAAIDRVRREGQVLNHRDWDGPPVEPVEIVRLD